MGLQRQIKYLAIVLLLSSCVVTAEDQTPVWRWSCIDNACVKERNDGRQFTEPALSLEACKMFCDSNGLLWPKPSEMKLGNYLTKIKPDGVKVINEASGRTNRLVDAATQRFMKMAKLSVPPGVEPKSAGKNVNIYLQNQDPDRMSLELDTPEGYTLTVSLVDKAINATIVGDNFFGIRNGLETLSQLFIYDDIRDQILIVRDVEITDAPVYTYRGILLDTSRNFFTLDSIRRTLDAMAAVKLNTFHWHITDSHSFPFVSGRRPQLSKLGAYSPSKVYTKEAIKEIVEYGLVRGIRVVPEFDAPAHVGEGWQDTDLTVCFNAQPWSKWCVEPPCGQLNPTKEELYEYLEDIYTDMAEAFNPEMFHMGGDEVSEKCWNGSTQIQQFMIQNRWDLDRSGFLSLWKYFQMKAQDKAYKAFGKKLPLILWTSTLTEFAAIDKYLNKDDYIIQVWTTGVDPQILGLLSKGYRLIMSNYDALYFDCGYAAWVGAGNNWCSPYIGWQKVYENSPARMAAGYSDQILGGEAALWSEQADTSVLDGRLWPRAAALAERLWAEPSTPWSDALQRMLHIRERLVSMGIQAESLQPEWCYKNEGNCYA